MVVKIKNTQILKVKKFLIFFYVIVFYSCATSSKKALEPKVIYKNNKAVEVVFFDKRNKSNDYSIYLKNHKKNSVLGSFIENENHITFIPIVPFRNGKTYILYFKGNKISEFTITNKIIKQTVIIKNIFPLYDSVPENLLKFYLVFSSPMQETTDALNYISVKNLQTNKNVDIFLPLETELWNAEHTELTLWLDPGRIKKDLIPNLKLGKPLAKNTSYEVKIDSNWTNANNIKLDKTYIKNFVVIEKDTIKPSINLWKISQPQKATLDSINILFKEKIDLMLIKKNVAVFNNNIKVKGEIKIINKNNIFFKPFKTWKKGSVKISVNSNLEDLAGNNFKRLFDTDLFYKKNKSEKNSNEIEFIVQ